MAIIGLGGNCYYSCPVSNAPNCEASKTIVFNVALANLTGTQALFNATNTTTVAYQVGIASGIFRIWNYGGGLVRGYTPTIFGSWLSLAYTYNSTGAISTIFENGTQVSTSAIAVQTGAVTQVQIFGNQWNEPSANGVKLEDLRVYNHVLTVNELITIANAQGRDNIRFGLSYQWPMNEGRPGVTLAAADVKENGGVVCSLIATTTPYHVSDVTTNLKRR